MVEIKDKIHQSNPTYGASAHAFEQAVCKTLNQFEGSTNSDEPIVEVSFEARGGSLATTIWSGLASYTLCLLPSHVRETYDLRAQLLQNGHSVREYHYTEYVDSWCWFFFDFNKPDDPWDPDTVRKKVYDRITSNLLSDLADDPAIAATMPADKTSFH